VTDHHDEHFESIPWDSLVTDDARRRRRLVYVVSGMIVVAALTAAIVSRLPGGTPATQPDAAAVPGQSTTTTVAASASAPVGWDTEVAAYAAWFAADFFTVDGSELTEASLRERLPTGLQVTRPAEPGRSFVESAIPLSVEDLGNDRFRVEVLIRSLASADGDAYSRLAPRAMSIVVETGGQGMRIVDLPSPEPLPDVAAATLPGTEEEPPPAVAAAAIDAAALWGEPDEETLVAYAVGDLWRVTLSVADGVGMQWPVSVWLDESGEVVTPAG